MTNEDKCPYESIGGDNAYKRSVFLEDVRKLINGDRAKDYGDANENFKRIATLWSGYYGTEFTPQDVAAMLGLLKVARIRTSPKHEDSWKDLAGYAALGGTLL